MYGTYLRMHILYALYHVLCVAAQVDSTYFIFGCHLAAASSSPQNYAKRNKQKIPPIPLARLFDILTSR